MMNEPKSQLEILSERLTGLISRQNAFSQEIRDLQGEIVKLKQAGGVGKKEPESKTQSENSDSAAVANRPVVSEKTIAAPESGGNQTGIAAEQPRRLDASVQRKNTTKKKTKSDFEKFIGENLINKIGIIITVIGVAIGAKYSIDHELVSPLTRIILGYFSGIGLLLFGIKLKKNYESYSAVLVSGAIAIMYFITFAAFSFYELMPQMVAFVLMLILTGFAIIAALRYNQIVIAHIGFVGAYAIPFLLSTGSGKAEVLFTYMAIINIGILILSLKKYWKSLFYSSFGLTWVMYIIWLQSSYEVEQHFALGLTFLTVFFAIFYITFLAYKVKKSSVFQMSDVILLLLNASIFYGIGYVLLDAHDIGSYMLGVFTLVNGIIHFAVFMILNAKKILDQNLKKFILGLVLVFITITIPVQLDGNWVTLMWIGEAAALFWIGRTKGAKFYEVISYPMIVLAFFSLEQDWHILYGSARSSDALPLLNIGFLTSVCFIGGIGFINYVLAKSPGKSGLEVKSLLQKFISIALPGILLLVVFNSFRLEIIAYWDQLYANSILMANDLIQTPINTQNLDLMHFRDIWVVNYALAFFSLFAFLNIRKIKNRTLAIVALVFGLLSSLMFLVGSLYQLSELRESFLSQAMAEYYHIGGFHLGIRYVSFLFLAAAVFFIRKIITEMLSDLKLFRLYELFLCLVLVWVASSELIGILDMLEVEAHYKTGLSILWGSFSLGLIAYGIWKNKKHLRIAAMILFGITLIKLFVYDISQLSTISKTIVFVALGVLLLIISFLYNKFRHKISDEA